MADRLLGRQAVVVGAGIGGLTAARVLADHFERVLILERDVLPSDPEDRASIPQGKHVHALLKGGQNALEGLLPGFERDLTAGGARPPRVGLDVRMERPGYDPFPQRDLGWDAYAMSRSLLELTVRRLVQTRANLAIRQRCRVQDLVAREDGAAVTGVRFADGDGRTETVSADLVVDASGRGTLTLEHLQSIGRALPEETTIGVDVTYATAVFDIPEDAPHDWKGVFCFPSAGRKSHGALMLPLEGRRWIVTVCT